jgi:hypothetical protein
MRCRLFRASCIHSVLPIARWNLGFIGQKCEQLGIVLQRNMLKRDDVALFSRD